MKYRIQHKIETLAENAVAPDSQHPNFDSEGITFTHWDFNHVHGWLGDAWLADGQIEASDFSGAYRLFKEKLVRIVPRIAFVSQCYTEFGTQPFLITDAVSKIGYFNDTFDSGSVGLMFQEGEEKALNHLLSDTNVSEEFFLYWNDAVNAIGYSSKLLIMFAAIEALAKKPNGTKDWLKIEAILGADLKDEIFKQNTGLRHRLTHGEYFRESDFAKNYVAEIHKNIVLYFNTSIFKANLISGDVVEPQRHLFGNKVEGRYFIRSKDKTTSLELKNVVDDFLRNRSKPEKYEYVFDDALTKGF